MNIVIKWNFLSMNYLQIRNYSQNLYVIFYGENVKIIKLLYIHLVLSLLKENFGISIL